MESAFDPKTSAGFFVLFQRLHTRQEYPGTGMDWRFGKKNH